MPLLALRQAQRDSSKRHSVFGCYSFDILLLLTCAGISIQLNPNQKPETKKPKPIPLTN